MKVLFVSPAFESIGIEGLSSYLKAHGHTTELAFDPQLFDNVFLRQSLLAGIFSYRETVLEQIRISDPDLVAFSVTGFDLPWAFRIAESIKKFKPIPTVFGGPHAWISPDQVFADSNVDYLIQGEGEAPLLRLVESLEDGGPSGPLPGTWFRDGDTIVRGEVEPPEYELDDLPFPDKSLYMPHLKHMVGYTATTGRVCVHGCSYCFYNVVKRLHYARWLHRRRSSGNVLAELREGVGRYRSKAVRFYDNDFAEDPKWLGEFVEGYTAEIGLPYHIQTHPNSLTPDTIDLLARSGCFEIQLGVQTVNPETRKRIGRRESLDQVREAVDGLRSAGIRCAVDMILGLPGETPEDPLDAGRFFNRHRPTKFNIFWLDYLPGADISRQAYDFGILSESDLEIVDKGEWLAGLFTGGRTRNANRGFIRMQMLLGLLPLVSPETFDRIVEKKWYRFFPTRIGPSLFWIVFSLLIRHPADIHRLRYSKLHWEFGPKAISRRIKNLFKMFF
jgi:radical SAM superfamily enzyme YgiQ (UPF0313 family)